MRAREFIFEQDDFKDSDNGKDQLDPTIVSVLSLLRQEIKDASDKFGEISPSRPLKEILEKMQNAGMADYSEEDLLAKLQAAAQDPEVKKLISNVTPEEVTFNIDDTSTATPEFGAADSSDNVPNAGPDTVSSMARHAMKSSK